MYWKGYSISPFYIFFYHEGEALCFFSPSAIGSGPGSSHLSSCHGRDVKYVFVGGGRPRFPPVLDDGR